MPNLEFKEDLGSGIEVWKGQWHLGNIRRNFPLPGYSYFPGPLNKLNPSWTGVDLDTLKALIDSNRPK